MRFIPTRVHGVLDYASSLLLIAAPYLFGFANGGPAQWVPMMLGAGYVIVSLITDYELSLVRLVPMPVHLAIDAAGGLFLAASPWIFGFADQVFWPHLLLGLFAVGAALTSRTGPDTAATQAARSYSSQ